MNTLTGIFAIKHKDPLIKSKNSKNSFLNYLLIRKYLYLMLIPGIISLIIFKYIPIYGIIIAFKDFNISKGIIGSDWVGLKHFIRFFSYPDCWNIIMNTVILSLYNLFIVFPIPIIFALLINEMGGKHYKKLIQTVSYMPYFLSTVVVIGIVNNFLSPTSGIVNIALKQVFEIEPIFFLIKPEWFRTIYNSINIWQCTGWNAIIYFAALTTIDIEQYEAAIIDGAGRFKQMLHVTLPGILPTIIITFLLTVGNFLSVNFEAIILLYNPLTYKTADVIATYVYRQGILNYDYSFSAAVGLLQSVIGLILIVSTNKVCKKTTGMGLW